MCGKATALTSAGGAPIGYKIRFPFALKLLVLLIVVALYQMIKKHIRQTKSNFFGFSGLLAKVSIHEVFQKPRSHLESLGGRRLT
jgi:hypothetical protein